MASRASLQGPSHHDTSHISFMNHLRGTLYRNVQWMEAEDEVTKVTDEVDRRLNELG